MWPACATCGAPIPLKDFVLGARLCSECYEARRRGDEKKRERIRKQVYG